MRSILIALLLLGARPARAEIPAPIATYPAFIRVGGVQNDAGAPDPSIAFGVNVRDHLGIPFAGSIVELNFADCSDLKLCTAVVNGAMLRCDIGSVRAILDLAGNATLSILAGATNDGALAPPAIAPGAGIGCVRVYVDGIQVGVLTAAAYDLNGPLPGGNGVNGLDLSIAKSDVGAAGLGAPYRGRTDYTGDGNLNGADVAVLKSVVGSSQLGQGSGAGCAAGGAPMPYCP